MAEKYKKIIKTAKWGKSHQKNIKQKKTYKKDKVEGNKRRRMINQSKRNTETNR